MGTEPRDIERSSRPGVLAGIALTGIAAGAAVGGMTNAVNGLVSPDYFVNTLARRQNVENVWRYAIAHGIFEGLLFGLAFSVIFTIAVAHITGAACTYLFAAKHLVGIVLGALCTWVLGGLLAMGLAALSPEFYRHMFRGVPFEFTDMLTYAWVGGSIWGVQFGGFLCLILGIVYLRAHWQREIGRRI